MDFVALKAEDDKLDINKLDNVLIRLNNLKTKVDETSCELQKIKWCIRWSSC